MSCKRAFRTLICSLVVLAAVLAALPAFPQEPASQPTPMSLDSYLSLVRSDLRSEKRKVVEATMAFTPDEAKVFWPVYDRYESDLMRLNNETEALFKEYGANYDTLTNEKAEQMAMKGFTIQRQKVELKKKYFKEFQKVLPAKLVARFFQVDRRLDLLLDLRIAAEVPIIQ